MKNSLLFSAVILFGFSQSVLGFDFDRPDGGCQSQCLYKDKTGSKFYGGDFGQGIAPICSEKEAKKSAKTFCKEVSKYPKTCKFVSCWTANH